MKTWTYFGENKVAFVFGRKRHLVRGTVVTTETNECPGEGFQLKVVEEKQEKRDISSDKMMKKHASRDKSVKSIGDKDECFLDTSTDSSSGTPE